MKLPLPVWIAIVAAAFALVLSYALAIRVTTPQPSESGQLAAASASTPNSEREALHRCQLMAQPDDACRRLWAENRRHFLGDDTTSQEDRQEP